jgi:hypothetical protein
MTAHEEAFEKLMYVRRGVSRVEGEYFEGGKFG